MLKQKRRNTMKKKILALLTGCLVLASAGLAMADPFDFSLAAYGGGSYTNVDYLVTTGASTVMQNLPIAVGAAFTETGTLGIVQGILEPGPPSSVILNTNNDTLYLYANGLAGTITSVTATGFTYGFTSGVGTISLLLGPTADYNPADKIATLATFSLIAPSNGTNDGTSGGIGPNGTTNLTALFDTVQSGVFSTIAGADFSTLIGLAIGLNNTDDVITASSVSGGVETATVQNSGQFGVTVVPEPGTFALLGIGFLGLALAVKRRTNA